MPSIRMERTPRPERRLTAEQRAAAEAEAEREREAAAKLYAAAEAQRQAEIAALAKARERAPRPPNALRGLEGVRFANERLRELGAVGILIGGVAKEICIKGETESEKLAAHKDVDVIIPAGFSDHKYHPVQWEGGIDWWVSHGYDEAPTNGAAHLLMAPDLTYPAYKSISPGLYLCPPEMLLEMEYHERGKDIGIDGTFTLHEFWNFNRQMGKNLNLRYSGYQEFGARPIAALETFREEHGIRVLDLAEVCPQERYEKEVEWMGRIIHPFGAKAEHCRPIE